MSAWTRREALTCETMVRQGLVERARTDVNETVRSILAIQAQEPAAAYVALWNRMADFDATDLDRAFADGSLIKTSLFRFTLHVMDSADLPWARAALSPRNHDAGYHDILEESGVSPERLDVLLHEIGAAMGEPCSAGEMEALVGRLVPQNQDPARLWSAVRAVGAFRNAVTDDPWSFGRRPEYSPCVPADVDVEAATAELIRRFLVAFGPASIADMAKFMNLKRSSLREVAETMDEVVPVDGPDRTQLLDVEGAEFGSETDPTTLPPRLLGMWDSVLLAYDDRSRVIPEEHRAHVIRRNGDVLPTVLVHGLVRGVWRARADGIEVRALEPLDVASLEAVEAEARSLHLLIADREPEVFSRVGRWWDRLSEGPTYRFES